MVHKKAEKLEELILLSLQRNVSTRSKHAKLEDVLWSSRLQTEKKQEGYNDSSESMVTSSVVSIKEDVAGQDSGLEIQEKDVLKEDYEAMKLENAKLEAKLQALEKEFAGQRALIEGNAEKLEASKQKCKMFEGHSSLLAFHVHELSERRELLEDELDFREAQLEDLEAKNKEATKKMQEEHNVEMMKKVLKIEGLEKEVAMLKKENAQMKEELVDKDFEKKGRDIVCDAIIKGVGARCEEVVNQCQRDISDMASELAALKKQNDDQKAVIEENAKSLEESKQKCKILEDNASLLAKQLHDVSESKEGLESKLSLKEEQLKNLEVENSQKIKKIKEEKDAEIEGKELKIETLQKEIHYFRKDNAEMQRKCHEIELELKTRQASNDAVMEAMSFNHEADLKQYQKQMEEMQRKLKEFENWQESQEEKENQEMLDLKATIESNDKEKAWFKSKLQELLRDNTKMHIKFLDEQAVRVNNCKDFKLKMKWVVKKCSKLVEHNAELQRKSDILELDVNSGEQKIKQLDNKLGLLYERLGAKDLVIEQLLQRKPKRRGIRKLFCC